MIGVLINSGFIIIGTIIAVLLHKHLKEELLQTSFAGIGLFVAYLGIKGSFNINSATYAIISLCIGGFIGDICDLDGLFSKLVHKIGPKTNNNGLIEATIIFCSGSMAIIGSIQAALYHNYTILISKGIIDGFTSIFLTLKYDYSVGFSALTVFLYQGLICLFSNVLTPLVNNEPLMNDLNGTGSIILIAIGLNLLGLTKIKTMNLLPAMVIIIILNLIF